MTAPKPRKEMLSRDYKAPKTEKGSHVELEGGRLISSATFTTSASKQEANSDKRKATGNHFGERVTVVTPPIEQTPANPVRALQQPPKSQTYDRPYSHLTDTQKALYQQNLQDNAPVVINLSDRKKKRRSRT